MEYAFITDLEDVASLASSELFALAQVWEERRRELEGSKSFEEFKRRLHREWAIETGLIERLYHWDRGVTELLIEQGIEASLIVHRGNMSRDQAEGVAALIQDQRHVVEGLFDFVTSARELSESYICELHAEFTRQQESVPAETLDGRRIEVPLLKGQYKTCPNNPRREDGSFHPYCPPEFVSDEMERLLTWYNKHVRNETPPEVLAAFLHHRFTQIHPFQDGNGRVARSLASLVFIKHRLFPLVIRDMERAVYIEALEQADQGRLKPLCDFFVSGQRRSILAALKVEQELPETRHAEAILSSGLRLIQKNLQIQLQDQIRHQKVSRLLEILVRITKERFETFLVNSSAEISSLNEISKLNENASRNYYDILIDNYSGHYCNIEMAVVGINNREKYRNVQSQFRLEYLAMINNNKSQLYKISREMLEGFPGCDLVSVVDDRQWERLSIITKNVFQFVVSFHGVIPDNQNILAATGFILQREYDETRDGFRTTDLRPAAPDFFQFNHKDDEENVTARFKEWLEESLAIGLAEWHKAVAREVVGGDGAT